MLNSQYHMSFRFEIHGNKSANERTLTFSKMPGMNSCQKLSFIISHKPYNYITDNIYYNIRMRKDKCKKMPYNSVKYIHLNRGETGCWQQTQIMNTKWEIVTVHN